MKDFEKPGSFYQGRNYDLAAAELQPQSMLYDSKDLTTHAVSHPDPSHPVQVCGRPTEAAASGTMRKWASAGVPL
jgi:hypothetical protein